MCARRKAVKVKAAGPGPGRRVLDLLRALERPFLVWALPAVVIGGFSVLGLHLARAHVRNSPRFRVTAPHLVMPPDAPEWWEPRFTEQINRSCAAVTGSSILDDSLLRRIEAGYLACPWVKQVRWVRKEFPRRVSADIRLRMPAAAVARREGGTWKYYLVGDDGVRLPKTYDSWRPRGLRVPFITGVRTAPPAPGETWQDPSVTNAIRIWRILQESEVVRRHVNITGIEVRTVRGAGGETEFGLFAERHCLIRWGRAPGTDRPGELSVSDKIRKFERYLREGNPVTNRIIDIRFPGRAVATRRTGTDGDNG